MEWKTWNTNLQKERMIQHGIFSTWISICKFFISNIDNSLLHEVMSELVNAP